VNFPQFLAEEMDGDEVLFMVVAGLVGAFGLALWYLTIAGAPLLGNRRTPPLLIALALTPLICLIFLFVILSGWSDPQVKNFGRYIFLFLCGGAAFLAIFFAVFPLLGLNIQIDVMGQHNPAVALVAIGGMLGVTFAYSLANIGEGPTIWTTIGPAVLSTGTLLLLWLLIETAAQVSEAITIDRDTSSGLRLAAFLAAAGLILGRAVAGNWQSTDATLRDFAKYGWPALILCIFAAIIHRACQPTHKMPRPPLFKYGVVPSLIYLAIAAGWLIYMGKP
jgi:hypothetical protein